MQLNHFLFWLPMIVIAFANATFRQLFLLKHFSELRAHQLSTITLMLLCTIYVWAIFMHLQIQSPGQAFLIGSLWVVLTVAFEFSLGRLTNKSWSYLFHDYHLFAGRIWTLFILYLFLLPYLFYIANKQ
jgi:hypothetical protein